MKTVIITGASRGIGRATALLFSQHGFNVVINYNKSEYKAKELLHEIESNQNSAALFKADVSNRAQVNEMIAFTLDKFSGIDVLVNNAGIAAFRLFTDITESEWDDMMTVNLKGVFNCTQAVLPVMIGNKKGKIINISSIWGLTGASCEAHYSAAKAAIVGLTKALAKELAPSNIQVNCVAPGVISTDMNLELTTEEMKAMKEQTPLGRIGNPLEIAHSVLFLAGGNADFITGQVLSPNGGLVI